jgi:DNA-binding NarL/FixJ family response regulator
VIRVLLAEDQAIVRAGFRALLDAEPDLEVAGEAADGREAVDLTRQLNPDLVVMDIRMPELDGLEATEQITSDPALTSTRILVLTTFELDEYVFGALRAGASGFLLKGGEPTDLLSAIRLVAAGEALLAPSVTKRLIEAYIAQPGPPTPTLPNGLDELTPRGRWSR